MRVIFAHFDSSFLEGIAETGASTRLILCDILSESHRSTQKSPPRSFPWHPWGTSPWFGSGSCRCDRNVAQPYLVARHGHLTICVVIKMRSHEFSWNWKYERCILAIYFIHLATVHTISHAEMTWTGKVFKLWPYHENSQRQPMLGFFDRTRSS